MRKLLGVIILLCIVVILILNSENIELVHYTDLPESEKKIHKSPCVDSEIYFTKVPILKFLFSKTSNYKYIDICSKYKIPIINKSFKSIKLNNYVIINKRLVDELNYLDEFLISKNEPKIEITSWYRSHLYNLKVNGAKCSRHVSGEAVDIKHRNIKLIINYLNYKYPNSCGIGTYSNYPDVVHFDIRRKKARW